MKRESLHSSDEELLRAADGELSPRRGMQVRAHLAECSICRTRTAEWKEMLAHFIRARETSMEGQLPSDDGPRTLLAARLRELRQSEKAPGLPSLFRGMSVQFAFAGIAIALLLTGIGMWKIHGKITVEEKSAPIAAINWKTVPDRRLTPGATRPVAARDICTSTPEQNWTVSASVRRRVLQEYGMTQAQPRSYELDYLVTPELGGANDIRNLWPEPYSSTPWNAHVKDKLENRLHDMVCAGQVDLPSAQREIATNWIAAYKKYFHVDKPLSGNST